MGPLYYKTNWEFSKVCIKTCLHKLFLNGYCKLQITMPNVEVEICGFYVIIKQVGSAISVDVIKFEATSMEAIIRVKERYIKYSGCSSVHKNLFRLSALQIYNVFFLQLEENCFFTPLSRHSQCSSKCFQDLKKYYFINVCALVPPSQDVRVLIAFSVQCKTVHVVHDV